MRMCLNLNSLIFWLIWKCAFFYLATFFLRGVLIDKIVDVIVYFIMLFVGKKQADAVNF